MITLCGLACSAQKERPSSDKSKNRKLGDLEIVEDEEPAKTTKVVLSADYKGKAIARKKHDNGLIVEDYVLGQGPEAVPGAELTLRYTGYLADGTVFDDTRDPKQPPFRFQLPERSAVKGWVLGLKGMKAGGKRKLIIPPALGYGEQGKGAIGSNATLYFTVDLLELKPPLAKARGPEAYQGEALARKRHKGGLRTIDYDMGKGEAVVEDGDRVAIHYVGRLRNGQTFEASSPEVGPFYFTVGDPKVIAGWNLGLLGMKVGGLRKLEIPPKLGYGRRKMEKIPKHSKLFFDVELMELQKKKERLKPKNPTKSGQ